jgi:polyhydroxybutyrate depolymerase
VDSRPFHHDGRDRPYHLHVPEGALEPAPLVVQLHGRGSEALRFDELTGFRRLADETGFVLALPDAIGEIWNDGRDPRSTIDDVGFLAAVVDDIVARHAIDERRVYFAGMSNGAAMAGRFAIERPERVTAFAQVAGTVAPWLARGPKPAQPVPILQMHGTGDKFVPYAGGRRQGVWPRLLMRRSIGPSVGVEEWAQFWVAANRALEPPEVTELEPDTTIRTWRDASSGDAVVFYSVAGGGHTWPGTRFRLPPWLLGRTSRTFDATRTIWDFFARHANRTISPST